MSKILTIEELFDKYSNLYQFEEGDPEYLIDKGDFDNAIIEIVKLYITDVLENASMYVSGNEEETTEEVRNKILNSYSLDNIK